MTSRSRIGCIHRRATDVCSACQIAALTAELAFAREASNRQIASVESMLDTARDELAEARAIIDTVHAAIALEEASRPIVAYYEKLRAWGGGCALPSEPTEGQITDFIAASRAARAERERKETP